MSGYTFEPPNETAESVGKRIALLRNEKGLTQAELANKMKVSRSLIATIESGSRKPDLDLWVNLSLFFGVSTDYIAGTSESRKYKSYSGCIKIDINRLSDFGQHMLYQYYSTLLNDSFCRREPPEN